MDRKSLDIVIPQYKEDFSVLKPMLDSLAIQQNFPFDKLGVIVVNDGSDVLIDESEFKKYPFSIRYIKATHNGVSATRNVGLHDSQADYIMFCDIDDMFCATYGLWIIGREMESKEGFDVLVSNFIEETRNPLDKSVVYVPHNQPDQTFVHGKVFRRKYLLERKIEFNPKLTIHEDSYFNILAQSLTENVKWCDMPFYMWKWRDDSVCRHDPKYILKTYINMLDSSTALIDELIGRGCKDKATVLVCSTIFDAYYILCKPEWINQENQGFRMNTELRFKQFYLQFKKMWDEISSQDKMMVSTAVRNRTVMEGMAMETISLDDWLKHIEDLEK